MVSSMANRSKDKGDRYERAAFALVLKDYPELVDVAHPGRNRAGRRMDPGDLHLFSDSVVQVKAYDDIGAALWQAAYGARTQAGYGNFPRDVGLVPVIGARSSSVNWLATTTRWPQEVAEDAHRVFGSCPRAVTWLRDDTGGIPRVRRLAHVVRQDKDPIWVAPIEAWFEAYRATRPTNLNDYLPLWPSAG